MPEDTNEVIRKHQIKILTPLLKKKLRIFFCIAMEKRHADAHDGMRKAAVNKRRSQGRFWLLL